MTPDVRFFEAVAQIMPILLLAALVEFERLIRQDSDPIPLQGALAYSGLLLTLTVGEGVSLWILADGEVTLVKSNLVIQSLGLGGTFLLMPLLIPLSMRLQVGWKRRTGTAVAGIVGVAPLVAGVVVSFVALA